MKSIKKNKRESLVHYLRYQAPAWAEKMLCDLANAPDFAAFSRHWEWRRTMAWLGGEEQFRRTQSLVRQIWAGEIAGAPVIAEELGLGLSPTWREEVDVELGFVPAFKSSKRSHIYPDWAEGALFLLLLDLNELVWMTLLSKSRDLAICKNSAQSGVAGGFCPTPYFIRYRPQQEFCSTKCSGPRQRETKRRWWRNKGKQWLEKRRKFKRRR